MHPCTRTTLPTRYSIVTDSSGVYHKDKKSCPIKQDIVLTGSEIVHKISIQ
jgi:hypothetical protein